MLSWFQKRRPQRREWIKPESQFSLWLLRSRRVHGFKHTSLHLCISPLQLQHSTFSLSRSVLQQQRNSTFDFWALPRICAIERSRKWISFHILLLKSCLNQAAHLSWNHFVSGANLAPSWIQSTPSISINIYKSYCCSLCSINRFSSSSCVFTRNSLHWHF